MEKGERIFLDVLPAFLRVWTTRGLSAVATICWWTLLPSQFWQCSVARETGRTSNWSGERGRDGWEPSCNCGTGSLRTTRSRGRPVLWGGTGSPEVCFDVLELWTRHR